MTFTSIKHGVYGGLAGGAVFGVMMGMMGMLPMLGSMMGLPTAWAGFVMHMLISAMIGAGFGVLVDWTGRHGGVVGGLAYGGLWWILGPLTLMPLFMGMGIAVNWNAAAVVQAMPSLMGHLVYGGILGWTYGRLTHRSQVHRQPANAV